MRYKAILLLSIAVILGGLAAYMVSNSMNRELAGPEVARAVTQRVVVAAADLPVGTQLEGIHLRVVELPEGAAPPQTFASVEEVLALESAAVVVPMQPGEFILPAKLSSGVVRRGLTAKIPDGYRAVAIPVNEVRGVGGFVLPGDRVDVLHTTAVGRRDEQPVTRTLLQDLGVLGVDQNSEEESENPVVSTVVTLLVKPDQAKTLTLAQQVGHLTLSLRNEGDSGEDLSTTVALNDLWDYGPEDLRYAVGRIAAAPRVTSHSVQVIRGLEVKKETFASDGDGEENDEEAAARSLASN